MHWIAVGTYDAAAHTRIATLIEGVRAHGYRVEELNEPLGLDTAARVRLLRQPWRLPRLGYRIARCWSRLARRARSQPGTPPDVVLVGYLGHFYVLLARALYPNSTLVLDHAACVRVAPVVGGAVPPGRLPHHPHRHTKGVRLHNHISTN